MADSVVLRRENLPKLLNYCEKDQKMGKEEKKEEEHEEEEDDGCLNDFTPYPSKSIPDGRCYCNERF